MSDSDETKICNNIAFPNSAKKSSYFLKKTKRDFIKSRIYH